MSQCGNFVFIGFVDGYLLKANLQSGKYNMSFEIESKSKILDIFSDVLNKNLVILDNKFIYLHDFFSGTLNYKITTDSTGFFLK